MEKNIRHLKHLKKSYFWQSFTGYKYFFDSSIKPADLESSGLKTVYCKQVYFKKTRATLTAYCSERAPDVLIKHFT